MLEKLFKKSAIVEVVAKRVAYSSAVSGDYAKSVYRKFVKETGQKCAPNDEAKTELLDYIKSVGFSQGDIVIVHSSMEGLRACGIGPMEIIEALRETIGEEGTIAVPAFAVANRKYSNGKKNKYDPKKSLCWTGMLPNAFLRCPGVIRSEFPYNSLAAIGPHAASMMEDNLKSDLPHGRFSSWKYCVDHDAKILYLGVAAADCNTVLHVVEDLMDGEWPIDNWYEEQTYYIKTENGEEEKTIRVCSSFWTRFNVCHHYNAKLCKLGLMEEIETAQGLRLGCTKSSKAVVDYMMSEAKRSRIRYLIPRRFWKKKR